MSTAILGILAHGDGKLVTITCGMTLTDQMIIACSQWGSATSAWNATYPDIRLDLGIDLSKYLDIRIGRQRAECN